MDAIHFGNEGGQFRLSDAVELISLLWQTFQWSFNTASNQLLYLHTASLRLFHPSVGTNKMLSEKKTSGFKLLM